MELRLRQASTSGGLPGARHILPVALTLVDPLMQRASYVDASQEGVSRCVDVGSGWPSCP